MLPSFASEVKMMTEKIYEKNAYCREFTATVISCEKNGDLYDVVLDKTAFFPEGGGQRADEGTIDGIKVSDVQIENEIIIHKTEDPLKVGSEVTGVLDWELRFSRMQSHSGEHIVSGIVHNLFGYTNVGFHMSESVMTVDFSGPLSREDIEKVELEANRAIYKNAPITVSFPSKEEIPTLEYRSKLDLEEGVRLVTIEGIDCCACCAPHPERTGEIGVIKILDFQPHKKGTRIEMVAGINAFLDYRELHNSTKAIMGILSAARENVKDAVEKQSNLVNDLRAENSKCLKRLAFSELETEEINGSVLAVTKGNSYDELRHCSNILVEKGCKFCILLSENEEGGYIYVVSSQNENTVELVKKLNSAFNGKGGGKPGYAQGKLEAENEEELKNKIKEMLS